MLPSCSSRPTSTHIFFAFFFFLAVSCGLQDLSSRSGIKPGPRQWKHQILTTRPPGNTQPYFLLWKPQPTVASGLICILCAPRAQCAHLISLLPDPRVPQGQGQGLVYLCSLGLVIPGTKCVVILGRWLNKNMNTCVGFSATYFSKSVNLLHCCQSCLPINKICSCDFLAKKTIRACLCFYLLVSV